MSKILGYICANSFCYLFLSTRTTIPSCFVRDDTLEDPDELFTCQWAFEVCCGGPPRQAVNAPPNSRRIVLSLPGAACISWVLVFAGSLVLLIFTNFTDVGTFVFLQICAFGLSWFFAYDTLAIESTLTVDDYMSGVVHFWGDMVVCWCCCACMICTGLLGGCVKVVS